MLASGGQRTENPPALAVGSVNEQAITAITDLLARVEAAEARAEKAERKRDEYKVALQNWHEED